MAQNKPDKIKKVKKIKKNKDLVIKDSNGNEIFRKTATKNLSVVGPDTANFY